MSDFNPSEHNIPDVEKHLEENPTELQAVLDAEKAGKNRPTLVSALEERAAKVTQPVEAAPVEVGLTPTPTVVSQAVVSAGSERKVFGKQYDVTAEGGHRVRRS